MGILYSIHKLFSINKRMKVSDIFEVNKMFTFSTKQLPTIASSTKKNGEIDKKKAEKIIDPHGYFKPKSPLSEKQQFIQTTMERLEKFKNKPNVFVHFTNIEKLGVNPQSGYKTPSGIYAYPLDYVLSFDRLHRLPFAWDYKNVFVFEAVVPVLDLKHYKKTNLEKDFKKLLKIYSINILSNYEDAAYSKAKSKTAAGILWYILYRLCGGGLDDESVNSAKWNALLRYLDYNAIVDGGGAGIIHQNEPTQALFTSIKSIKILEVFKNKVDYKSVIDWIIKQPESFYNRFMKDKTFNEIEKNFKTFGFDLKYFLNSLGGFDSFKFLQFLQKRDSKLLHDLIENVLNYYGYEDSTQITQTLMYFADIEQQKEMINNSLFIMKKINPKRYNYFILINYKNLLKNGQEMMKIEYQNKRLITKQ
jgi:hypothetical protein